jgi:hypothetical protein
VLVTNCSSQFRVHKGQACFVVPLKNKKTETEPSKCPQYPNEHFKKPKTKMALFAPVPPNVGANNGAIPPSNGAIPNPELAFEIALASQNRAPPLPLQPALPDRIEIPQPEDVQVLLAELYDATHRIDTDRNQPVMSEIQWDLLAIKMNLQNPSESPVTNATVRKEMEKRGHHISCPSVIRRAIVRTVLGRLWYPGIATVGNPGYLGEVDQILFKENIRNACHEVNCVTTFQARAIAFELIKRRYKRAVQLLLELRCPEYITDITSPVQPSADWLRHYFTSEEFPKYSRPVIPLFHKSLKPSVRRRSRRSGRFRSKWREIPWHHINKQKPRVSHNIGI